MLPIKKVVNYFESDQEDEESEDYEENEEGNRMSMQGCCFKVSQMMMMMKMKMKTMKKVIICI